jgi:GlpG protein
MQVLEVGSQAHAKEVSSLFESWRSGELEILVERAPRRRQSRVGSIARLQAPVTMLLIGLSIVGFAIVSVFSAQNIVALLTFSPIEFRDNQIVFYEMGSQYWRLITPAFLHFGVMHVVFNCLWLWEFGRQIERVGGHFNMLMLCLAIAAISNASQFVYGGPSLFGGMSGVVYGLLGFATVAPLFQPNWPIQPKPALIVFMMLWLFLCISGVIDALLPGGIANAAHVGGLISGAVLGAILGLKSRLGNDKT